MTLAELLPIFDAAVPPCLTTASADGVPNTMHVSRAYLVDEERLALSRQFLHKTARNLEENPWACLLVSDPQTYRAWRVDLCFEGSHTDGELFERLAAEIEAIASLQGMSEVFRLRAADVYRVLSIEQVAGHEGDV